ncbi:MAG TPA: ribosome-associated translation inhibitor RaiA [Polyangiaceae bacterium]|nr:ribosome-associated translation inhibitor RaiA [Polyangiaceae bacterium]
MNITVTFRHVDASDALRDRATAKLAKLQKFLRQPMTARVTVSLEKLKHQVEARVSSGGERYEAHEATDDMYTSIDKVLDKLERQIRGTKGAAESRKRRSRVSLRKADGAARKALSPERSESGGKRGNGATAKTRAKAKSKD